jgi:dihydroneopterin aldolase
MNIEISYKINEAIEELKKADHYMNLSENVNDDNSTMTLGLLERVQQKIYDIVYDITDNDDID